MNTASSHLVAASGARRRSLPHVAPSPQAPARRVVALPTASPAAEQKPLVRASGTPTDAYDGGSFVQSLDDALTNAQPRAPAAPGGVEPGHNEPAERPAGRQSLWSSSLVAVGLGLYDLCFPPLQADGAPGQPPAGLVPGLQQAASARPLRVPQSPPLIPWRSPVHSPLGCSPIGTPTASWPVSGPRREG